MTDYLYQLKQPPEETPSKSQDCRTAVLQTVAYADIFDQPLTEAEIHRFLCGFEASQDEVSKAVFDLVCNEELICEAGSGWIARSGRGQLFNLRRERNHRARGLWRQARWFAKLIGRMPFVRMVAITGSLAVNNPDENADIDLFIVTEPRRLWLARLMIVAVVKMGESIGIKLCPNYFLTTRKLKIDEQNLYTAREICQMVPIVGDDIYHSFRQVNGWTNHFFPNSWADNPPYPTANRTPPSLLERFLGNGVGNWLETWEMERKIAKLQRQGNQSESSFSADQCKGHFEQHQAKTFQKLEVGSEKIEESREKRVEGRGEKVRPGTKLLTSNIQHPTSNILFGQSYYLRFDPKLYAAMQPYPPLGTMIAAAMVRDAGYSVDLFDAMLAESTAEWEAKLAKTRPEIAIIYEDNFNYLSKMCLLNMRDAALEMIRMAKSAGATVILCGSDATDHPGLYLKAGADFVIQGEGEETLLELLSTLKNKDDPSNITGLATMHNGQMKENGRRPVMKNIDRLLYPAWDLVNVEKYRQIWLEHHGYFSMNMVTTRGCPYHCNWCAKPIWGQRYNARSAASVAGEMAWLKEKYAPDHIWFVDDIMGLKPGWWQEFGAEVERLGAKIPFKCLSRADLIVSKADTATAMATAGCDIVWLGAESGAQHILNKMDKGTTVEQIYDAAEQLHSAGIKVAFFLQFGYPGETREDIEATLQMVRDCRPDDIGMSVSYPLPGTRFYDNVRLQLGDQQNWTDSADLAMMYQGPFVTDFYRQLHIVLHKEFRSRKGWQMIRQVAGNPTKWRLSHGRELLAIGHRMSTLPFARIKLNRLAQIPHQSIDELPHMSLAEAATPSGQE